MATIKWNVHDLERETSDGYVYKAHFRVDAVEDEFLSTYVGTTKFKKPNTLIPYKDLTESKILEWIKANVDSTAIEASLNRDIAQKKEPVISKGLPWVVEDKD